MEVAVEVEDDAFFADLSKQINLLIMDDDDGDLVTHSPSVSFQGFSQAIQFQQAPQLPIFLHEQISCRTRESKGTGVFIPRSSSHQRRKTRQGIRNNVSSNAKMFQKQFDDNSRGLPAHHNYTEPSSYNNSFNPRRF